MNELDKESAERKSSETALDSQMQARMARVRDYFCTREEGLANTDDNDDEINCSQFSDQWTQFHNIV